MGRRAGLEAWPEAAAPALCAALVTRFTASPGEERNIFLGSARHAPPRLPPCLLAVGTSTGDVPKVGASTGRSRISKNDPRVRLAVDGRSLLRLCGRDSPVWRVSPLGGPVWSSTAPPGTRGGESPGPAGRGRQAMASREAGAERDSRGSLRKRDRGPLTSITWRQEKGQQKAALPLPEPPPKDTLVGTVLKTEGSRRRGFPSESTHNWPCFNSRPETSRKGSR